MLVPIYRSEIRIVDFICFYYLFFQFCRHLLDNSMTQYDESYLFFLFSEGFEMFTQEILQAIQIFIDNRKHNNHYKNNSSPNE